MKWSLKIGTYAGIGVYLHWTFILLVGLIFLAYLNAGETLGQALGAVVFILALFTCIVLHEYGHALTARRYGLATRDITLLPIGGVARLERIPEKPMQEFWVAVAGPAVNVVIAAVLFVIWLLFNRANQLMEVTFFQGGILKELIWVNLIIVAFNLLPAFPMDGGRVLRALLAMRLGRRRATAIAANIGQVMAILLGTVGFYITRNPLVIFVAIFVYLGAQGEAAHVETQSALEGLRVRNAMMTRFRTLSANDFLSRAIHELLAGSQQDFPVVENGQVLGILRRNDLVKALAEGRQDTTVADVMCRDCTAVNATDDLARTLESMRARECASVPVTHQGEIIGLLTLDNLSEVMMINAALAQSQDR